MEERVILVDRHDRARGVEEKLQAHRLGSLHRAFSVFVLDPVNGSMLLQQRALHKYHSGGLWSNTCCSHPRPGESTLDAAHRRLREEMGFDCALAHLFSFIYKADLEGGMIEHEFDHVFVGQFDGRPRPDHREVADWHWVPIDRVRHEIVDMPEKYTVWFRIALRALLARAAEERPLRVTDSASTLEGGWHENQN